MRKWRRKLKVGGFTPWTFEIGSAAPSAAAHGAGPTSASSTSTQRALLVAESAGRNPEWHAKDAFQWWEWHVTNISFPVNTYSVTVDAEKQQLVLRTTNKKFFKRWSVDVLRRRGLTLEQDSVAFTHDAKTATLMIRYRKPQSEIQAEFKRERDVLEMIKSGSMGRMPSTNGGKNGANPECNPS